MYLSLEIIYYYMLNILLQDLPHFTLYIRISSTACIVGVYGWIMYLHVLYYVGSAITHVSTAVQNQRQ